MSELTKLLEGVNVEWRAIDDYIAYLQPTKYLIKSKNYNNDFETPVLTAGKTFILGYTDEIDGIYKAKIKPVIIFDDFTTANKWVDFDFKAKSSAMKILVVKDENRISLKYFFYLLNSLPSELVAGDHKRQWISNYANKLIPIPCPDNPEKSLKIQQEIVRILDRLSEETNQLNAALHKELNIHHKNHNFYRERLMNFEGRELKWKTLEEVAEFQNGKGHEKVINPEGKYIVVNSKFISTNGSVAKHSNVQITPLYKNDILIVMSDLPNGRALARTFLVTENDKYTLNQRIGRLTIKNTDSLNPTFLCYFLNRNEHLLKYNNGIDQTNLQKKQILDAKIPTVSVSEQLSIVAKLNDLNLTTANLVSEIQKEITLRNKQYEYYRDRLLSFQSLQNEVDAIQ